MVSIPYQLNTALTPNRKQMMGLVASSAMNQPFLWSIAVSARDMLNIFNTPIWDHFSLVCFVSCGKPNKKSTSSVELFLGETIVYFEDPTNRRLSHLEIDYPHSPLEFYIAFSTELVSQIPSTLVFFPIPSGKLSHNYGKSPFSMGKSTISMVIFNSCVKLPEGKSHKNPIKIPFSIAILT